MQFFRAVLVYQRCYEKCSLKTLHKLFGIFGLIWTKKTKKHKEKKKEKKKDEGTHSCVYHVLCDRSKY